VAAGSGKHRVAALAIAPQTYATLGDDAPDALPPYLDYGYGDELGALPEAGGMIALHCGTTEIAAITYADTKPGRSRELTSAALPNAMIASDPASWCDAATTFEADNLGTPRVASDCIP